MGETRTQRSWLVAAVVVAAVYAAGMNDFLAVRSDSGLYLALGRSLAEGRGMEFNGVQMWGVPPGLPLLIAACLRVAGDHYWLINMVLRAMGVGIALAASGTVWHLAADLPQDRRRRLAIATLLVVGLSERLFIGAAHILTDVPFSFLIAAGLYAFVRARRGHWAWCLAGAVLMLAATLTRLLGPLFFIRKDRRGHLLATAAGGLILAGGTWAWMACVRPLADPQGLDYMRAVDPERFNIFGEFLWIQVGAGLIRFPDALCEALVGQQLAWINLVPTALVLVGLVAAARRRQWLAVVPAFFYIAFLLVWGFGAVAPRYLLPAMPMLAYALLLGVDEVTARLRRRTSGKGEPGADSAAGRSSPAWAGTRREEGTVPPAVAQGTSWRPRIAAVTVAAAVCLAISLPKVARDIYWLRQPRFYAAYEHGKWQDVLDLGRYLAEAGRPETDWVATPDPSLVHYLSRLRVVAKPLWEKHGPWDAQAIPPDAYAEAVVRTGVRFVVAQANAKDSSGKDWSGPAMDRLAATGVFLPPRRFGNLALYERRPAGG
jgi:hypothetical protein